MKKLTDKQKIRLWEQRRGPAFAASWRLDVPEPDAQEALFAGRLDTLELGPLNRGLPWLCAIHHHIFQGVEAGAGKIREVDISRGDTRFCHFEYIETAGNDLIQALEIEHYLVALPKAEFIRRLAHYYCEINMLHPFFIGSGRAQRVFFEQLAIHAGYVLDWSTVEPQAWHQANQSGAMGDLAPLTTLFSKVVSEARETE